MNVQDDILPVNTHQDLSRLAALIYVFGINKRLWERFEDEDKATPQSDTPRLRSLFDKFDLKERDWDLLEYRVGFGGRFTLDEIGVMMGGFTRAYIGQIEQKAIHIIERHLSQVAPVLYLLETQSSTFWPSFGAVSVDNVLPLYRASLLDMGWEAEEQEVRRLLLTFRALIHGRHKWVEEHFPSLTYLACVVTPAIKRHSQVALGIEENAHSAQPIRWTYEKIVEAVLEAATEPLHYIEIYERATQLGYRTYISQKALHGVLWSNESKFALTDTGTYGLKSRGFASVDHYVNIGAAILRAEKNTVSFGDLLQQVNSKRVVKQTSLQMMLDLNVRFYRSKEGLYGLRAWLPPREKQNLRTPGWLVEDKDSFERVAKAIERGYNVEAIVSQDKP